MNRLIILIILVLLNLPQVNAQTPWLHVSGNQIQDPAGNKVILRGVAIQDIGGQKTDPTVGLYGLIDKLSNTADAEAGVPGWYTKVIRFTINPPVADFQTYFDNILKPAVDSATSKGLYVIIDNHYISSVEGNIDYTNQFWAFMAPRFKTYSNVLYEIYNEPVDNSLSWGQFKHFMQDWVDLIRKYAPHNLILVGNPNWDQVVGDASTNPVIGSNLVYVAHVYPGQFTNAGIRSQVQTAAAKVPVFLSEWGFSMTVSAGSQSLLGGTVSGYGDPIMTWAEGLGLSWTAWCADNDWEPAMFTANWILKTGGNEMGQYVKQKLYDKKDLDQPADIKCVVPFLGPDRTICSDNAISVQTGLSPAGKTFTWYKDSVVIAGQTGPSLGNVSQTGKYMVKVDSGACSMTDDINVVDTIFRVNLISDAMLTSPVILNAGDPTDGYTYQWFKNGTLINSAIYDTLKVFDTCKTKYSVIVSYPALAGCGTSSDSFTILCKWGYFLGYPFPVPGKIEAEDYDIGNVPGLSYYDTDAANMGGKYRTDDVDIETCTDGANQFDVGWTAAGEYMNYSIKVTDPGTCGIIFRIAGGLSTGGGTIRVDIYGPAGVRTGTNVTIPYTGGWQTWQNVILNGVDFAAGDTMIRLNTVAGGFNLNYIDIRAGLLSGIINHSSVASTLTIFPNPTNDFVNFSQNQQKYNWKICNMLGQELLEGSGDKADLSSLQKGPYILMINGEAHKILKW
jgi:endoglucanase